MDVSKERPKLTAGLDLGDKYSYLCLIDTESGDVVEEGRLRTTPEDFRRRFRCLGDRDRSTCRRDPIRLSSSVALCYHPWWADPPLWAVRARRMFADPRVLRRGSAFSSHLPRTLYTRSSQN